MISNELLESWALRACEALQEFCDEAQIAAGNPDGEDQLQDIRALLDEHSQITADLWQSQLIDGIDTVSLNLGTK